MDTVRQISLIREIFALLDAGETPLAPSTYRQPVKDYTSPDTARNEQRLLFGALPMVAGLSGDAPDPGDYFADTLNDTPVLLIRQKDGSLRAFENACRHRGSPLVRPGKGKFRGAITCPFHGWSYRQTGELGGMPGAAGFAGEDRNCLGLLPLPVHEDVGIVRIKTAPDTGDASADFPAVLKDDLAPLSLESFHHHRTEHRTVPMNWKLVMDTFLETYHFPVLHKNSVDAIFIPNCGPFEPMGDHLRLIGIRRSIESLRNRPESEWSLIPHATIVYLLFPNAFLILQTGHVELWRVYPEKPACTDSTRFSVSLYAPKPIETAADEGHWNANLELLLNVTMTEDFTNGAAIQTGFRAGHRSHLLFGRNEPALIHFHQRLAEAINAPDRTL